MFGRKKIESLENRIEDLQEEQRNYTELLTNALVEAATTDEGLGYISALETSAGALSRAFAAGIVEGANAEMFTPWTMAQIGRSLVETGETIWYRPAGNRLIRVDNYGIQPSGTYQLNINGADPIVTGPDRVLHVRWNVDVSSGRGVGPLTTARVLKQLMNKLEVSIGNELNAAVGYLLPIPTDGASGNIESLKADIANLKGKIAVIETARQAWGQGMNQGPRNEYALDRLGPDIPDSSVRLFESATRAVFTACGFPVSLAIDADGTGQREAWRRYLHGTVAPLGRLVIQAASDISLSVSLDWQNLFASDITGRARAFQSLVGAGMDINQAATASGLLNTDDT